MKCGKLIGIGTGKKISLYCRVERMEGNAVVAWVINGNWTAKLHPTGTLEVCEKGTLVDGQRILFRGQIPKNVKDDYNAAIEYMESQLDRWPLTLWLITSTADVVERVETTYKRFDAACNAFMNVWSVGRAKKMADRDYSDEIPF